MDATRQSWVKIYLDTAQRAREASDPALAAHFEAERKQIKFTLDAMDIQESELDGGYQAEIRLPGLTARIALADPHDISESPPSYTPPGGPPASGSRIQSKGTYPSSSSLEGGNTLGPGFPPQGEPYRKHIENASKLSGVPADLLAGLIHDESRWKADAGTVNGGNGLGDTGLVQMNDGTFTELQQKHPELRGRNKNDPETNILAGAFYLSDMRKEMATKYGRDDWEIALRAYNSGPNGVDPDNLHNLPAGTGTDNYVDKVMNYWNIVRTGGQLPA